MLFYVFESKLNGKLSSKPTIWKFYSTSNTWNSKKKYHKKLTEICIFNIKKKQQIFISLSVSQELVSRDNSHYFLLVTARPSLIFRENKSKPYSINTLK